ncbi:MAG: M23 family metallopeptidase [Bacteroidales bacterium]|nr:M23 family metallopeptidase [Bacteroidales bacterium]MCI6045794.1 M23 family metallopeptidase [Alistipes sp.]MDY4725286.1 M23 family metallopeptidase [Candidatus Cryptobacteroides sp.]MDY5199541.1 M23 family metallopeptidase [Candidatus Cryptobacteroides sp.]
MGKYILNPETLLYEMKEVSLKSKVFKGLLLFAGSVAMAVLYIWLFTSVLGYDLPKTAFLKAERARWDARMDLMNTKLDRCEESIEALRVRDDDIYRSIFGMNEIPAGVRNAGIGGVDRYSFLDGLESDDRLKNTALRIDRLTRKVYVQSKSFDEVAAVSKTAGDMASCIPAIPPIVPDPSRYKMSSPFGYRTDPFTGASRMHTGLDFAMKIGNPVYATGDGVVESVKFEFFGYGNSITIKHGFGYETIYAHLNSVKVIEGMKVKRGDCIGESGKSGRSSGPHLHYEVVYKGRKVNPANYLDMSMSVQEYSDMLRMRESESGMPSSMRHSFSVRHR